MKRPRRKRGWVVGKKLPKKWARKITADEANAAYDKIHGPAKVIPIPQGKPRKKRKI